MNISCTALEEVCKSLLQRSVSFIIKNKVIKKGKIELFTQRNFHIVFHLLTGKNKKEKLEIPIPFSIENHVDDGLIFFDYRVKSLSKYFPEAEYHTHVDHSRDNARIFSMVSCIQAPESGGELEFPFFNVKIPMKTGIVILFPSNFPYIHTAHAVESGIKYSLVTWYQ